MVKSGIDLDPTQQGKPETPRIQPNFAFNYSGRLCRSSARVAIPIGHALDLGYDHFRASVEDGYGPVDVGLCGSRSSRCAAATTDENVPVFAFFCFRRCRLRISLVLSLFSIYSGMSIGLCGLVFVTVFSGAFVAGNGVSLFLFKLWWSSCKPSLIVAQAGLVYNEFPLMGGRLIPSDIINP